MEIEMTRISSKGQVVIPGEIRERMDLKDGTRMLVFGENDTIILKKISGDPSRELKSTLYSIREHIKELKVTRKDVEEEIRAVRASHAARSKSQA